MATTRFGDTYGTANPTGLTDGSTYVVQNKSEDTWVAFLDEPATYTTIDSDDGVWLAPRGHDSGTPNWLKFTYTATRVVRVRAAGPTDVAIVEFIESE